MHHLHIHLAHIVEYSNWLGCWIPYRIRKDKYFKTTVNYGGVRIEFSKRKGS